MNKNIQKNKKRTAMIFVLTLMLAIAILIISILKTNAYNATRHKKTFTGEQLFEVPEPDAKGVSLVAEPRDSTWSKAFDLNNEGIEEHNYQAYTIDYTVANHTKDEVKDFTFKIVFRDTVFLHSAWNGALEIHQKTDSGEVTDTVLDMREFVPEEHKLDTFSADGEHLVVMKTGDYLYYRPSSSVNAMEVPIEPLEATTPGIIMYFGIGEDIDGEMMAELEYTFHRKLAREPLFWIAQMIAFIWMIALLIYVITSIQIKKYQERHERDNVIINESIETFIGFIDAKDPYTNGHSIRVAKYTRRIAEEYGYDEEELERIYYVALLHDCGKIGVPDSILGKPDRLTDEEFEVIKSHTVRGGAILSRFKSLENSGEGALYHHERYDGKGYPEGKAGEDIPFIARMICLADSYDAMNTDRVYRKRLSKEKIISEIENGKGKQFDPEISEVVLKLIENDQLNI